MRDPRGSTNDRQGAGRYEIRLKGSLDPRWAASFDGLDLLHPGDGTTVISGPIADQAALHGLLRQLRDLGLPLVSIAQVEPDEPDGAKAPTLDPR